LQGGWNRKSCGRLHCVKLTMKNKLVRLRHTRTDVVDNKEQDRPEKNKNKINKIGCATMVMTCDQNSRKVSSVKCTRIHKLNTINDTFTLALLYTRLSIIFNY